MISHVSLGTKDLARSGMFYDAIFAPLGIVRMAGTKPGEIAYGPQGAGLFWLYEVAALDRLASPGTHVAFAAASSEQVHSAAEAAKNLGAPFTRDPGHHPDIAADYYGTIFLDPDGHKLEIVFEQS